NRLRLQCHAANWAVSRAILLNLRMHRAGVDNLLRLAKSWTALERHSAFWTTARRVALHLFAHRAEVLLRRLLFRCCYRCLRRGVKIFLTAGMICTSVLRRQFHWRAVV